MSRLRCNRFSRLRRGGGWFLALASTWLVATRAAVSPTDYERELKPLLKARCFACHGALKQKAGLRLDTGAALRRGSREGPVIVPENPAASRLLQRVLSTDPTEQMPPEGERLTAEQVEALRRWIAAGAPSPANETPEADPRDHWAFRPPQRPTVPSVARADFPLRNPIDAFVAARWGAAGLQPAPPAERATLLRRVYLDLIGLPPTPSELQAYLTDARPEAYEHVVEGLLNSPRHGERWARHWMDIWRYADWFGRRHVPDVWNSAPQIWRWRNWIVDALNSDQGYHQMIVAMLAGDEANPDDPASGWATGFLVRNWYALNPNQWMRDNVEHTAKAFLGLTLQCAHCHDHKYDPISQRDYFAFRAFFEPLGLRQDWVAGETDPGPFQKYEYSSLRKVVREGSIRVFDENPDAPTYLYLRGDERSFPPDKPIIPPATPVFLTPEPVAIAPIMLPAEVRYPGLQEFVRAARRREVEAAAVAARSNWTNAFRQWSTAQTNAQLAVHPGGAAALTSQLVSWVQAETALLTASNHVQVAEAQRAALEARIAADDARWRRGGAATEAAAQSAAQAESQFALARARQQLSESVANLRLLEAEQSLQATRQSLDTANAASRKTAAEAAADSLRKARESWTNALAAVQTAEAQLATNRLAYTPLSPVYADRSTGRRLALAQWIARRDNPLTARVAVNHVWGRHFHEPLVKSVNDFGRNGAAPTHPELLDWLAVEFMEHGWSLKHLHRLIVTSSTYRLASGRPAASTDLANSAHADSNAAPDPDPENRWLSRMNLGRLESESIRDALLFSAGALDFSRGGYPLANADADKIGRRSLYFECFPEEGGHDAFTAMFDPPDPGDCYRRTRTMVPQQALALANSQLSDQHSRQLAARLWAELPPTASREAAFVHAAFATVLSRAPRPAELQLGLNYLRSASATQPAEEAAQRQARLGLVRALINHNDFVAVR